MIDRVVNLTFHGLGEPPHAVDPGEAEVWVSVELFERTLDAVRGRDDVAVTFDDGYESDARIALPALAARGMKASFFVVADRIGAPGHSRVARSATWLPRACKSDRTDGAHRAWRGLAAADLRREIVEARDRIAEASGRPVTQAACPFGSYDRRALGQLRAAGFDRVYTSDRWYGEPEAWFQPRFTVHRDDTPESVARIVAARPGVVASAKAALRLAAKRWR